MPRAEAPLAGPPPVTPSRRKNPCGVLIFRASRRPIRREGVALKIGSGRVRGSLAHVVAASAERLVAARGSRVSWRRAFGFWRRNLFRERPRWFALVQRSPVAVDAEIGAEALLNQSRTDDRELAKVSHGGSVIVIPLLSRSVFV